MPSAKTRVKQKERKSKFSKTKGTQRSKSCGYGKIYDIKTKKCRRLTRAEQVDVETSKGIGYSAGTMLGGLMGQPGVGAIIGRAAGGKYSKLRQSGQGKRRK